MKQKQQLLFICFVLVLLLGACAKNTSAPKPPLIFEIPDTELPLSEDGPYDHSILFNVNYVDPQRENREVSIVIFYPVDDDQPDLRGAPFPLIIGDHIMAHTFGDQLASHGFVVAGLNLPLNFSEGDEVIHQPLDFLFMINQLTENPPGPLTGLIDTDHVGHWGYSGGGRVSLTLAGAQIDPNYYLENCKNPENFEIDYGEHNIEWMCEPYKHWDELIKEAGQLFVETEDGLWKPITDERIIAIIPMSSMGDWLFGPDGLAQVDKAVLVTAGTNEGARYEDCFRTFEEIGSSEKFFVSFVGRDHNMIGLLPVRHQMSHLAIAFFSYHLKGKEEYRQYFSEDYISQIEGLAWGWYEE
jgi:predicted dienelactone hydrolase